MPQGGGKGHPHAAQKVKLGELTMKLHFFTGFMLAVLLSVSGFAGDLADVKKAGVLKHLGIPYANFVSGAGDGMDVEMMKMFADYLGVKYEFVKTDWSTLFEDVSGQKVKVSGDTVEILGNTTVKGDLGANGITILPYRQKLVDFGTPTFPNQIWLIARADSAVKPVVPTGDLSKDIAAVKELIKGRSLLGKAKTCIDPSLYKLETVTDKIKFFEGGLNDVAPAMIEGEAELALLDVPDALVALQKWPGKIKILGPVSDKQYMGPIFAKSSPALREEFNKFFQIISHDGRYLSLVKKYFPYVYDYHPEFFKEMK